MTHTLPLADVPPALRLLLDRLRRAGDEIVITDGDRPVARVTPLGPARVPGLDAGRVTLAPDFDAPLPDDLLDGFEGRP